MSRDVLNAQARTQLGSNAVKKLRNNNLIPGILYGHHIESQSISLELQDFDKFSKRHGVGASLDLDLNGEKVFALFKNIQFDPVKRETIHVEFQALSAGEKIKMKIPFVFKGKDTIAAGLLLQEMHHELDVHVLPKDIIEVLEIDVTNKTIGDHLTVQDLDIVNNSSFEIMDDLDTIIYAVSETKVHVEPSDEDEIITSVPVIGEEEAENE